MYVTLLQTLSQIEDMHPCRHARALLPARVQHYNCAEYAAEFNVRGSRPGVMCRGCCCVGAPVPSAFPGAVASIYHASRSGDSRHLSPGGGILPGSQQGGESQHDVAHTYPVTRHGLKVLSPC